MTYKLTKFTDSISGITTEGDTIIRIADNAAITKDEQNNDYQDYLAWVAEGNTAQAAD